MGHNADKGAQELSVKGSIERTVMDAICCKLKEGPCMSQKRIASITCNLLQTEGGSLHVSETASGVQVLRKAPTVQRKEGYSGAKALGLSSSSSRW